MPAPSHFDPDRTLGPKQGGAGFASSSAPGTAGKGMAHACLTPGTVLQERYEVIELLGEGGMGAVYKANDLHLDRVIALKTIRPELASSARCWRASSRS